FREKVVGGRLAFLRPAKAPAFSRKSCRRQVGFSEAGQSTGLFEKKVVGREPINPGRAASAARFNRTD
ncbi:MAG TPA: hypothetical protein PK205_17245, partial [Promineifilum sp.]|nr:hypothetical protein [Promineifilum sp.]